MASKFSELVIHQTLTPYKVRFMLEKKSMNTSQQINIDERTVLNPISVYNNAPRVLTTDNFFTTMKLAKVLYSSNVTLVCFFLNVY